MKIRDAMTREVRTLGPSATIQDAARLMAEIDAGAIPVEDGDRLVGMITDRDIAVRAIGAGKGPDATVREIMSAEVKYCSEDDAVADVCENMSQLQLRRLPVVNADKRLVGIVSLADLADRGDAASVGAALEGITRPSNLHNQSNNGG